MNISHGQSQVVSRLHHIQLPSLPCYCVLQPCSTPISCDADQATTPYFYLPIPQTDNMPTTPLFLSAELTLTPSFLQPPTSVCLPDTDTTTPSQPPSSVYLPDTEVEGCTGGCVYLLSSDRHIHPYTPLLLSTYLTQTQPPIQPSTSIYLAQTDTTTPTPPYFCLFT